MNKNNNTKMLSKNQKKKLRKADQTLRREASQPQLNKASDTLPVGKMVTLGATASAYARTLANPATGPLSSVPVHPAQLSKKFRVWVKGTFDVQTSNGIGWIAMSPDWMIANDYFGVFGSSPGGTSVTWFEWGGAPGTFQGFSSNSEYASGSVGPAENQFEYRVVSAELKARYIGTELNRSGQMAALMDSNHQSLYLRTLSSIDGEETSLRFPVDRTWTRVLYRPVDNDDFEFTDTIPGTGGAQGIHYMGIAVQAPAGVSTPFEFEGYATFEIFGKNIRAMTPSHTDPVGFGAVHAVSQLGSNLYPTKRSGPEVEKAMVKDAAGYIANNTSTYSHVSKASTKKKNDDGLDAILGTSGAGIAAGMGLLGALSFLF
jgi:hypothetical protein